MNNNDTKRSAGTIIVVVVAMTVTHGVASRITGQPLWLSLLLGAVAGAVAGGLTVYFVRRCKKP